MDIEAILKNKAKFESDLLYEIAERLTKFHQENGICISGLSISFDAIHEVSRRLPFYRISNVKVNLGIE